ncbi:MAG: hypothetical protein IKS10_01010 [Lachnospiraceae bacterium]|nr:hypothetical protein [Lachnospiraceae bacterium]
MKQVFFRLSNGWLFWLLLAAELTFVPAFSMYYYDNRTSDYTKWEYYVEPYSNATEIQEQIIRLQGYSAQIKEKNKPFEVYGEDSVYYVYDVEFEQTKVRASIDLLQYLMTNEINYEDVGDGEVVYWGGNTRRFFSQEGLCFLFVFQMIIAVVWLIPMVMQAKTNGAITFDYFIMGRKNVFARDAKSFYLFCSAGYFLQVVSLSLLRIQMPMGEKWLLYWDDGVVTKLSTAHEFIDMVAGYYLLLIFGWTVLFAGVQLINNMLGYLSIMGAFSAFYAREIMLWSDEWFRGLFSFRWTDVFTVNQSVLSYFSINSVRLAFCAGILFCVYRYNLRRKIALRYE